MRHTLVAAPVALLTALVAIPVAGYAGATLAAAFDSETRDGLGFQVSGGLVSSALAFAIFGPIVVCLGICAAVLLRVPSRLVMVAAPLVLIALLSIPAAVLVVRIAPDPAPIQRVNEPVLAQIASLPGATSEPLGTFNASGEWESRDWVTRRVDVLAPGTTTDAAVRHYRGVLWANGWKIEDVGRIEARRVGIWAHRLGRRIVVRVGTGTGNRVELDLR